jgi:hypothetical protein
MISVQSTPPIQYIAQGLNIAGYYGRIIGNPKERQLPPSFLFIAAEMSVEALTTTIQTLFA